MTHICVNRPHRVDDFILWENVLIKCGEKRTYGMRDAFNPTADSGQFQPVASKDGLTIYCKTPEGSAIGFYYIIHLVSATVYLWKFIEYKWCALRIAS